MKKRLLSILIAFSILFQGQISLAEEARYRKILDISKINSYKVENNVMLPIREVAEALGYEVSWNEELCQVELRKGAINSSLKPGENYYFIARMAPKKLDQSPEIYEARTYVPLDFFTEILDENLILAGRDLLLVEKDEAIEEDFYLEGYIKDIIKFEDNYSIFLSIEDGDLDFNDIYLHIVEETIIEDRQGEDLELEDLSIGNRIEVRLPRYMTISIPPQTTALKIVRDKFIDIESVEEGKINYPKAVAAKDSLKEGYFNQALATELKKISDNEKFQGLELDYSISYISDKLVSLIFKGSFMEDGRETDLIKTLNIDLENGREIGFNNYFKSDKESRANLFDLIRQLARENYGREFNPQGINMYFTENEIVLYYYENSEEGELPLELSIDRELIEDFIEK